MIKNKKEEKMKSTFCQDCIKDPNTCGKDVRDCIKEAKLYFSEYENPAGWTA